MKELHSTFLMKKMRIKWFKNLISRKKKVHFNLFFGFTEFFQKKKENNQFISQIFTHKKNTFHRFHEIFWEKKNKSKT